MNKQSKLNNLINLTTQLTQLTYSNYANFPVDHEVHKFATDYLAFLNNTESTLISKWDNQQLNTELSRIQAILSYYQSYSSHELNEIALTNKQTYILDQINTLSAQCYVITDINILKQHKADIKQLGNELTLVNDKIDQLNTMDSIELAVV